LFFNINNNETKQLKIRNIIMNRSSSKGIKLTTVVFAVLVLTVSALLSNNSIADDMEVQEVTSEQ